MGLQLEGPGRTLAVIFTCRRCGKNVVLPYEDVMQGERHCLHDSKLPQGWKTFDRLGHPFCEKCEEAYNAFIAAGKAKEGAEDAD